CSYRSNPQARSLSIIRKLNTSTSGSRRRRRSAFHSLDNLLYGLLDLCALFGEIRQLFLLIRRELAALALCLFCRFATLDFAKALRESVDRLWVADIYRFPVRMLDMNAMLI